jgi:hypothetical protein
MEAALLALTMIGVLVLLGVIADQLGIDSGDAHRDDRLDPRTTERRLGCIPRSRSSW